MSKYEYGMGKDQFPDPWRKPKENKKEDWRYQKIDSNVSPLPKVVKPDETVLNEAQRIILNDRNRSYDHPLDNFERIGAIWSVIFGIKVTAEQVGLAMAGLKLARESFKHSRDNLVDGAGYLGTIDMVIQERERRANETD
ncbi:MAG: hypothetical protein EBT07_01570 [Actinobacteria bacterium]|nr:hypothetical protein [Actinomycetota bacterium]